MISHETSVAPGGYPGPSKQNRFTCTCCRIKFDSTELQRAHFKGEWHLYNLKRKVCNLNSIDLESFNEIQAAYPSKSQGTTKQESSKSSKLSFVDAKSMKSTDNGGKQPESDDDNWTEVDGDNDEFLDEDYDDDEAEEMLARVIKCDTCLFCDKKGSSLEDNTKHMYLMHGFFIPEEQYMIDRDGFMEYLGFKVGAGATCLWCNKQFTSVQGVRRHMIDKDHCKLLYDQQSAVDEFKEFYDYSSQKQFEMKPFDELVVSRRRYEQKRRRRSVYGDQKSLTSSGAALIRKTGPTLIATSCQARAIKMFQARRAKILLRTALSNNKTLMSRFRNQNPI